MALIQKIISGGQSGADIAGLDVAIARGLPHGGWCPRGRRSEAGPIPPRYQLTETPSPSYLERTEWNVRDSDGTVVFTLADQATGGSLETIRFCKRHSKPCLHLTPAELDPVHALQHFIDNHAIHTLNIAGSRASNEPEIYDWTTLVLDQALGK